MKWQKSILRTAGRVSSPLIAVALSLAVFAVVLTLPSVSASMAAAGFGVGVVAPRGVLSTPLPPSALLFLSAVAGFAILGWRRRSDS